MHGALLALPGALIWLAILALPWRPWRVRERLEVNDPVRDADLGDITVLIPARNEAALVAHMLEALLDQGRGLKIVLVDDQSHDATAQIARRVAGSALHVVKGRPLPAGWTGKLWALEQGRAYLDRPLTLLVDADIELRPGILVALRNKLRQKNLQLVSLMAELRMVAFWEKLLMPAFVYFFRLLYPFALANDPRHRRIAAAAGGCILLRTGVIEAMGGFKAIRGALIDDCELARCVKGLGGSTWVGLTRGVRSLRRYDHLGIIWNMVARSAFTQLRYSSTRLFACTVVFALAFWLPVASLGFADRLAVTVGAVALTAMAISYVPTLRYYQRSGVWVLALPLIATLYLCMTWSSALRYWRGQRSRWRDRVYTKTPLSGGSD
jgi:hopene-associated glycosyltransferase HpnB